MSVLTLLTDALLLGLLVWLIRGGALAHARGVWCRAPAPARASDLPSVHLRLDDFDSLVVTHRTTARRWHGLRPAGAPILLEDGGEGLRIDRTSEGVVVASAGGVAVVAIGSSEPVHRWPEDGPEWIVTVGCPPSSSTPE